MTISEETRENVVNDVRNGMSYRQVARKYGIEETSVERWCRAVGVQSLQAIRWKTNEEILDAVMLYKAVTCRGLASIFGCGYTGLNTRLRRMVQRGKIQSFRIAPLSHGAHSNRGLFTKYINTRIYYVSKDDLAKWVKNQLPDDVPMSSRRYVTHIFRSIGVDIFGGTKK